MVTAAVVVERVDDEVDDDEDDDVAVTMVSRRALRREQGGMPRCRFIDPTTPASPRPEGKKVIESRGNEE